MEYATRQLFSRYLDRQAELAGQEREQGDTQRFTATPAMQQTLITKQQDTSAFLKAINIVPVQEMTGEILGLGISGPLASRTNTTTTDRATQDPTGLDNRTYACKQTNSDTHLTYAKLDMWAKFKDFQARISNAIVQRQALDRMMIGMNGASAAVATDPATYPLRQDVNVGWLQAVRAYDGGSHRLATGATNNKVTISPTGAAGSDYRTLDALVYDVVRTLLPPWAQDDPGLVAIVSRDLLADKYFPLVNKDREPSEQLASDIVLAAQRIGGLAGKGVPYVPANTILITRFDNLSIYEQAGKRRRTIVDNAKRDRVETYESSNDAYVVEDFDFACLVENIQIVA